MFIMVILILSTFGRSVPPTVVAEGSEWDGGVFVGLNGKYKILKPNDGVEFDSIHVGGSILTGCAFSPDGSKFYGTKYSTQEVVIYDTENQSHIKTVNVGAKPESVTVAENGDTFVGNAGDVKDGIGYIRKFSSEGVLQKYPVEVENQGADWITLSSDQRTIFYTSKGNRILRYDVIEGQQLDDFAVLDGQDNKLSGLELLEPGDGTGGLIVANYKDIKYINASGIVVKTYDVVNINDWSSVAVDSSGESFWAKSGSNVYKFNIDTGQVEINEDLGETSYGVCVKKQIPPKSATLDGPKSVEIGKEYPFTVNVSPHDVTLPLTYIWTVNGEEKKSHSVVSRSDTYMFKWDKAYPGEDPIIVSVAVENGLGQKEFSQEVTIIPPGPVIAPEKVEITADDGTPTKINTPYDFTATVVSPENATAPITYTWEVTENDTKIQSATQSDTQTFEWETSGPKTIKVWAENAAGKTPDATIEFTIPDKNLTVTISGPTTGAPNVEHSFIASVEPTNAELPLTYQWSATDHTSPEFENKDAYSDDHTFTWTKVGNKEVTVVVKNTTGTASITHTINITITCLEGVTIESNAEPNTSYERNTHYIFKAKPNPKNADDGSINYTWSVEPDGAECPLEPGPDGQGISPDQQCYTWSTPGEKTIKVQAKGPCEKPVEFEYPITIKPPQPITEVSCECPYEYGVTNSSAGYYCDVTVGPAEVTLPITYTCTTPEQDTNEQTSIEYDRKYTCGPYTWDKPGTKDITVNVSNEAGQPKEATCSIEIYKSPEDITLVDPPTLVVAGEERMFTARVIEDDTSTPLEYTWKVTDQEDKNEQSGLANTQIYAWETPGSKKIEVTAQNQAGARSLKPSHEVEVIVPPDSVDIVCPEGVTTFKTNTSYEFTAFLPEGTSDNFTYTWNATDYDPDKNESKSLENSQSFTWNTTGKKEVSVTVQGRLGNPVSTKAPCVIDVEPVFPERIDIKGPTVGDQNTDYPFFAEVFPKDVTLPLTFKWEWVDDAGNPITKTVKS